MLLVTNRQRGGGGGRPISRAHSYRWCSEFIHGRSARDQSADGIPPVTCQLNFIGILSHRNQFGHLGILHLGFSVLMRFLALSTEQCPSIARQSSFIIIQNSMLYHYITTLLSINTILLYYGLLIHVESNHIISNFILINRFTTIDSFLETSNSETALELL